MSVRRSPSRRGWGSCTSETAIHIQSTAIRSRAIAADIRATRTCIRATAADSREIGIYIREIATYIRAIAADIQEMAVNFEESGIYRPRTAAAAVGRLPAASLSRFRPGTPYFSPLQPAAH